MRILILQQHHAFIVAVLCVVGLDVSASHGQLGLQTGDFAREFRPDFLRRDLQLINDRLALGPEQQEIAETVLQDYIDSFDQAAREAREQLNAAQPAQGRLGLEIQARQDELRVQMEVLLLRLREAVDSGASPEQIEAMQAEIKARIDAVKSETEQLSAQAASIQPPDMEQVTAALRDRLTRWRQYRGALYEALTTDIALILDENQRQQWEAVQREMRRQRLLPEGELAGEKIDLFNLLRQTGRSSGMSDEVDAAMSDYADALNAILAERERVLDESTIPLWRATWTGDDGGAAEARGSVVRARVRVRDLHFDTAARLTSLLGAEAGATFDRALRRQAFGGLIDTSYGARLIEEAVAAPEVAPEVRAAMSERLATHRSQWEQLQIRLEQVILNQQPIALAAEPVRAGESPAFQAQRAMGEASRALSTLDLQTIQFVVATLGETQFMELASAPAAVSFLLSMQEESRIPRGLQPEERRAIRDRINRGGGD